MAIFATVESAIKAGKIARLPEWPECKAIRTSKESDHDYFMHDINLVDAIIEDCPKVCDCKIGIWIPQPGEKESEEWVITQN